MKRIALITAVLGTLFLLLYIILAKPISVASQQEIEKLIENQKIFISGKVMQEKQSSFSRTLMLDSNISIVCECNGVPRLTGKYIEAVGFIDIYQKTQIKALKIKW